MLQIRKKLQNVFKHFDTDLGDFILSKGYFKIDKGIFQIIEDGGARRMLYSLSEITIYDDTASGFPETFLTDVALYNRLFELGYNLIDYNGVNPSTPTVYASESPIDAPFTGSNTFELPLNYILISVFLDVDLRIKAEYIRTPTGIIILDTLVDGNIISIRGFIASGSIAGGSVISVSDDDNGVVSVNNSNPANPIIKFNGVYVDGTTVTGDGTEENPLTSVGGGDGVTINDETPSLTQTYSSEKSEDTFVKRSGTEVGKDIFGDLKFVDTNGISTEEIDGMRSRMFCDNGKWYINILGVDTNPEFQFNPDKGMLSNQLFDIDNDENAYLQKGHIVQLEENVFNLQLNKADLVGGLVPSSQLPAYVDDVLELANLASFPVTGEVGKIYVALDSNKQYRWSGSSYIQITNGLIASTNDVPEGSNLYFTTARVLSTLLTGISFLTGGAIVSTDSVLVAFGKIQKQINDFGTAIGLKQDTLNEDNFGTFTNSVGNKETQANTDVLAYVDVTTGKWVKQTFSKLVDYLKGFFVTKKAIVTNASVSGTFNIDASLTDTYNLTLTGNTTLALINTSSTYAEPMAVYITGLYTLAYPAGATLIGEYLGNRKNQLVIEKIGGTIYITVNNYV